MQCSRVRFRLRIRVMARVRIRVRIRVEGLGLGLDFVVRFRVWNRNNYTDRGVHTYKFLRVKD